MKTYMKQALLIIDVQNDYFPQGKMALHQPQMALENILRLRQQFRRLQLPIFYIQHINIRNNATFFLPDSHGVELHPQLLPISTQTEWIIRKNFPNSFVQTDLLTQLQKQAVEQLVICGMMTHMCIDSTTRQAAELNFQPILIADACATRDLELNGETIPAKTVQHSFIAALSFFADIQFASQFLNPSNA